MPISRQELAERIQALPPAKRIMAIRALKKMYEDESHTQTALASYAGYPLDFFRDVLGAAQITPQQERVLELIEGEDRLLVAAANNVGKTWLLGGLVCYYMGAIGSQLDEEGNPQRARVLLPGPNHKTVFATVYSEALKHAERAAERGYTLPGSMSTKTVRWLAGPGWEVEAFSPPRRAGERAAHSAGGRHEKNQVAIIEEGAGCTESLWKAVEGMCSSEGNKIISPFNPTEINNPAYLRSSKKGWVTVHLSALEHPNVIQRKTVITGAIGHEVIDKRVEEECEVIGDYPTVLPDDTKDEFVYALPPAATRDTSQPRTDSIPGHKEGVTRVYRPSPAFQGQVLGRWPEGADGSSIFSASAWDESVARWEQGMDPLRPPDRIGVDLARTGSDEIFTVPCWGETASQILKRYRSAKEMGDQRTVDELQMSRIRIGVPERVPNGDGPDVAEDIDERWPSSILVCDEGGVGASAVDHLNKVLGRDVHPVAFAGRAEPDFEDEPYCEDVRTQMFWRLSRLVKLGLVDVPPDPQLREEVLACQIERCRRVINGQRREAVRLVSKVVMRREIGRSPDRGDACVLSCHEESSGGWYLTSLTY